MLIELLAIAIFLIALDWILSSPFYWGRKGVPFELPIPIFGSNFTGLTEPTYKIWKIKYDKWKRHPYYGFHFFRSPALFISDPELIKKLFVTDSDHFMSHALKINKDTDAFTWNLFHIEDEEWRTMRNKLSPYFTPARVKSMSPLLEVHLDRFMRVMEDESAKGPVEVQHNLAMRLTTDVIVSSSFGLETNSFSGDTFFYNLQRKLFNSSAHLKMMLGILSPRMYDFLQLTMFDRKVTEKVMGVIKEAVGMRLKGVGIQPDILQGLVDLMKEEEKNKTGMEFVQNGSGDTLFGLNSIAAQALLMYMAGSETTGTTLGFALHELAYHPDIQEKVRQEIFSIKKDLSSGFTFEEIQNMTYMQLVIQETLRKYPSVPFLPRKCTKDYWLGDVKIEKGTVLMASVYGVQMDPQYFFEPEKFNPDRFASEGISQRSSYFPFGVGPRTCLGRKFALNELSFALARILSRYRMSPCEKSSYTVQMDPVNINMTSINGIWLNIERI